MKTVGEIDRTGKILRIFHRTATASWTHLPGETYTYRGGRHGKGQVTMECPCRVSDPPAVDHAVSDADGAGRVLGPPRRVRRGFRRQPMDSPGMRKRPLRGAPGGLAAEPDTRRHLTPADPHDVYMFGLGRRIRWLERHRHWFLRTPEGRAQREFLDRRDVA